MPEFYMIVVRKIFFPNFRGTRALSASPISYAYGWLGNSAYRLRSLLPSSLCGFKDNGVDAWRGEGQG